MNLFGYIRVSGLGQVEKDGPLRQKESISAFAIRHDLNIADYYQEDGVSGEVEGMDRPAFSAMLLAIQTRNREAAKLQGVQKAALLIEGIVVENWDRVARTLKAQEMIVYILRKEKLKLFITTAPLEDAASQTKDPDREFMRQVMGAMAELDKSKTVRRLASGRARKRKISGICEGAKRYGQKPGEDQILESIYLLRETGNSYSEIASCLNRKNLTTRFGRAWTWQHVSNVLNNWRANRQNKTNGVRPLSEIVKL